MTNWTFTPSTNQSLEKERRKGPEKEPVRDRPGEGDGERQTHRRIQTDRHRQTERRRQTDSETFIKNKTEGRRGGKRREKVVVVDVLCVYV